MQDLEPLVDPVALERFLLERLPQMGEGIRQVAQPSADGTRFIEIERHMAGHSNETFFVRIGEQEWVLRRPPRGAFLPTAHDVGREYRVLSALVGTGVRAPRPILLCDDSSVIGAPFYLMERVDGVVIRNALPRAFASDVDARGAIGEELVDALAELHAVDWKSVGLDGFGRPDGYLERQIRRWKGQLALTEPLTRPLTDLHRAGRWLEEHIPSSGQATIVHGDYKLDNVSFHPEAPARLVAILDWEMSTLGDPLADVGWMLSFWREAQDPAELIMDEQTVTRLAGFPPRDELLARYQARSGRRIHDLTFYMVLAVWKLAVLLEGSYARHLGGQTDDPFFANLQEGVPALASMALELCRS
jgi:aminoglycoside phosphotransferase (APT) family kinase protein